MRVGRRRGAGEVWRRMDMGGTTSWAARGHPRADSHGVEPAAHVLDFALLGEVLPDITGELAGGVDADARGAFSGGHGAACAQVRFLVEFGEFVAFFEGVERGFEEDFSLVVG